MLNISLDKPVPYAATAEPNWCAPKIHPNTIGPLIVPKNCPLSFTVGGTVAIKSRPKKMAHRVRLNTSKLL